MVAKKQEKRTFCRICEDEHLHVDEESSKVAHEGFPEGTDIVD